MRQSCNNIGFLLSVIQCDQTVETFLSEPETDPKCANWTSDILVMNRKHLTFDTSSWEKFLAYGEAGLARSQQRPPTPPERAKVWGRQAWTSLLQLLLRAPPLDKSMKTRQDKL